MAPRALPLLALLALCAAPALAQAAPEAPARFIPCAWFPVDLGARRLASTTDTGALVRFWTAGSTIRDGENIFGPKDRYPDGNYSREFWNRLYDEAIRRYNSWAELEKLLEQQELCDWPGRLILGAILRGNQR